MNQEIAQQSRWGRPEIKSRAVALAERVAHIWPPPTSVVDNGAAGVRWDLMNQALAALPTGSWTSYGDLAALIGSHAVPVGVRLASHPAPNAHRVLQVEGTHSPNFRWLDPERTDNPVDLLKAEGVEFDDHGRANAAQRITTEELAYLASVTVEGEILPDPAPGQDAELRDRFLKQLNSAQSADTIHGVLALLAAWTADGGTVQYGQAEETSCFMLARTSADPRGSIWPLALYPAGKAEVVFQHIAVRTPFDDITMRDEFRKRLNEIPGVDLPAAKLALRPGFDLVVLGDMERRALLTEHLGWFLETAQAARE